MPRSIEQERDDLDLLAYSQSATLEVVGYYLRDKGSVKPANYYFIPNKYPDLVPTLRKAYAISSKTQFPSEGFKVSNFLDVGSGLGNIINLASNIGFSARGIEYNQELAKISRARVEVVDALEYQKYHLFDVIYYYCPIRDYALEATLELKIEHDMKSGALLIPYLKRDQSLSRSKKFSPIEGFNIWRKK
jgi:hypothetical protein